MSMYVRRICCAILMAGTLCGIVKADEVKAPPVQPENHDLFFGKLPRIYLDGVWKYTHTPGNEGYDFSDDGMTAGFFNTNFDDSGWDDIQVPGERRGAYQIGYYRRHFNVPGTHKGMRAILNFQGVGWEPVVFVNGKEVARPESLIPGIDDFHKIDVTDALRFGRSNQITVRIYQTHFVRGIQCVGIHAPVRIEFVPAVYVSQMKLTPQLPNMVNVDCQIINTLPDAQTRDLTLNISPWETKYATGRSKNTRIRIGKKTFPAGKSRFSLSVKVRRPVLWSVYNPFLYGAKLTAGNDILAWERFGLRSFEAKGNYFYLNNKKLYLPGIAYPEGQIGRFIIMERSAGLLPYNPNGFMRRYYEQLRDLNCLTIFRYKPVPCETTANLCDEIGLLVHSAVELRNETELSLAGKRLLLKDSVKDIPQLWHSGSPYHVYTEKEAATIDGTHRISSKTAKAMKIDPSSHTKIADDLLSRQSVTRFLNRAIRRLTARAYNSPSFVMWAPEGESNRVPGITHRFPTYKELFKKYDPSRLWSSAQTFCRQGRRQDGKMVSFKEPPPYDFVNFAAVTLGGSSMNVNHFTVNPITIPWTTREWARKFYKEGKPIVATEALFYGFNRTVINRNLWNILMQSQGRIVKDGKVDKKLYAKYMGSRDPDLKKSGWWSERKIAKVTGIHDVVDHAARYEACGRRMKLFIEQGRIHDDLLQGFGSCSGLLFDYSGRDLVTYNAASLEKVTPMGEYFRQACAPLFVCAPLYNGGGFHHHAGGSIKTDIYCFNNLPEDAEVSVLAEVVGATGNTVFSKQFEFGVLPAGEKAVQKFQWNISPKLKTGAYALRLFMSSGSEVVSENDYQLYILDKREQAWPRYSDQMIALFAGDDNNPIANTPTQKINIFASKEKRVNVTFTQAIEKSGYPITYIKSLKDIGENKLLIIGPGALNSENVSDAGILSEWMENGGRLLCLEQTYKGKVPFLPDLSWEPLRVPLSVPVPAIGIDADLIEKDHPIFAGINNRLWWRTWNSPYGEVYRGLIRPLCDDMIATGAELQLGERPNSFGMLISERKVGKGHCILSQVSAIQAIEYGDSVAVKYLHNLFEYFLLQNR